MKKISRKGAKKNEGAKRAALCGLALFFFAPLREKSFHRHGVIL